MPMASTDFGISKYYKRELNSIVAPVTSVGKRDKKLIDREKRVQSMTHYQRGSLMPLISLFEQAFYMKWRLDLTDTL